MSLPFPEPTGPPVPRAEVLLGYLDYFRSLVLSKVQGLSDDQLRMSVLPSGWAVLELVKHLTHVERRWLVWGFEGQPVAQPWGDSQDGRWHVSDTEGSADLVRALQAQGSVTSSVARAHDLCDVGRPGERWEGADPRTRPSTYEHRSRGLLGVPSQVALHGEAPERCAEHHRRVQAELVDQAAEVVGPGVQVPVVRSAQITVAVPTPIGSERRKAFSPGLDADMLAAAGAR